MSHLRKWSETTLGFGSSSGGCRWPEEQTLARRALALKAVDPSLPVMVATGYASEETTADCQRRGALESIKKPFDSEHLLRRVREIVA